MKNNFKRILTVTATVSSIVIGCQVGSDRNAGSSSKISDFSEAKNCGLFASIGDATQGSNVYGKIEQLPAPITLSGQIIACGGIDNTSDENWHAIGVGIERGVVMIDDRSSGTTYEAQPVLENGGIIKLYVKNAVHSQLGTVPSGEIGMPIDFDSKLTFEIRNGATKIDLSNSKSIAPDQMTLWIVK